MQIMQMTIPPQLQNRQRGNLRNSRPNLFALPLISLRLLRIWMQQK